MERLFKLESAASSFIQNPINYHRVQAVLDAVPSAKGVMVKNTNKRHNMGFSGRAPRFLSMLRSLKVLNDNLSARSVHLCCVVDMTARPPPHLRCILTRLSFPLSRELIYNMPGL